MPRTAWRVVCGRDDVIATFEPTSALTSVDSPAFGRPTRLAKPLRNPSPFIGPASGRDDVEDGAARVGTIDGHAAAGEVAHDVGIRLGDAQCVGDDHGRLEPG